MSDIAVGIAELRQILRDSAGVEAGVDLDGEILDITFEDLGYDSIAVLETAAKITQEYGVPIDDDALTVSTTPRELLALIGAG
ncbi:MAG TPA: acyl carrier protein [Streptosporangiaceae bacterium]|nr:acyl carrier protein [Streptosporangiaceae bacterium]